MKIPMTPPNPFDSFNKHPDSTESISQLVRVMQANVGPAHGGRYHHWDKLRYLAPPSGLSHLEWWMGIKLARRHLGREIPLKDKVGRPFRFTFLDIMFPLLQQVDKSTSGSIRGGLVDQVTNPETRDTYLFQSLAEEAITSSQLEGAATTRKVAKEMIRSGRQPLDKNEQMILNNYEAMRFIQGLKNQPLTPRIVMQLQLILTEKTLDDPTAAGRLRRTDEPIVVEDQDGQILHHPPDARDLESRLDALCRFANDMESTPFLHPTIRAILLHFWLAYDHPFVDGNGRTARALFYWSMAAQDYWLFEFISISRILKEAPSKYHRAFLYTETDDNDTTYFILNQLSVILRAVDDLHEYLRRKSGQLKATQALISQSLRERLDFNERQLAVLNHARKNAGFIYTFDSHRRSHGISYQTARTDLMSLHDAGLLDFKKRGKQFNFYSPVDIEVRLKARHRGAGRKEK